MSNITVAPFVLDEPPAQDEVDASLVPIFLEEADELLPQMDAVLQIWQAQPDDLPQSVALKRLLHSFKGSARMAGALRIGAAAHQIENRLQFFAQNRNQLGDWDSLRADFAQLAVLLAPLRQMQPLDFKFNAADDACFGDLQPRLARVVQQTALSVGKSARLDIVEGGVALNRGLLNKISSPLEHVLRNAVVHGIELPAERLRLNKPIDACIRLSLRLENAEYVLVVSDDGAGLDLDQIYKKSNKINELQNIGEFTFADAARLIFKAGFSTAETVTEIAGRGIGLAAAQNEISALGGRIEVASPAGLGTEFTFYWPQ